MPRSAAALHTQTRFSASCWCPRPFYPSHARCFRCLESTLGTLNISGKSLVGITRDPHRMTGRPDSSALWLRPADKSVPATVRQSLGNVAALKPCAETG